MSRRNIGRFLLLLGFVPLPGFIFLGAGGPGEPRNPATSFRETLQVGIGVRQAYAQEGWRDEFDAVCAKTDVAMTLSENELSERIGQCDRLKARIEGEGESTRKVYLRRLQMCQDLYRYVLEGKRQQR